MRSLSAVLIALIFAQGTIPGTIHSIPPRIYQQAGQEAHGCTSSWFYYQALDRIFLRPPIEGQKEGRVIIFQIRPSFQAESQVAIREGRDRRVGSVSIFYSELADKKQNANFDSHIADLCAKNPDITLDDAVRGIRVKTKAIDAPLELLNAIQKMPDIRAPANMADVTFIDGTIYELWVDSGQGNLDLLILHDAPITNWMTQIEKLCQVAPGHSTITKPGGD
ncbi:MAG TPA: hypothetical protein VLV89_10600 [Candidatus Acidoferrum sp.]|nr:hypothetical protein [Candidatus Acidoferrum sp.]